MMFDMKRNDILSMTMVPLIWQAGIENIRRASSLNDSPTFIQVSSFVCLFVCLTDCLFVCVFF